MVKRARPTAKDVAEKAYLSMPEAAIYLSLSESTFRRESVRRPLPLLVCGRVRRVKREDLDAWAKAGKKS